MKGQDEGEGRGGEGVNMWGRRKPDREKKGGCKVENYEAVNGQVREKGSCRVLGTVI